MLHSALAFHTVQGLGGFKCLGGKFEHQGINRVCNKKDSLSLPMSPSPFSSHCGIEPSCLMETQGSQGSERSCY